MPDHAVLYNRSPISDRKVNNNYKLSHAVYVAAIIGMIEVRLYYHDQIAGAIEILQVPLHFKHFYLYCYISPISVGRKGPLGQLTTHILYTNLLLSPPKKTDLQLYYSALNCTFSGTGAATEVTLCGLK